MEQEVSMNKMGVEPVGRLMIAMGIPMILSMMLQAFYNIVDSYFVSAMEGLGDLALNALTLAFPIQMLMVAIGVGTGVGVNALLSKYLGMGERETASRTAGNAILISICTYFVFFIFGMTGVDAYIKTQTSDPVVMEMACSYLKICTTISFGSILFMIYEKLLQSTGRTVLSTIAQITGAVVNIVLDPILIFGYFGIPKLGIAGAAYATVAGQIVSLILGMIFHHGLNKDVDTGFRYLKPDFQMIKNIYQVGIPAIVMQALMSVMTYCVNVIFGGISSSAVTAYGIYYKIQQFIFFAAFGLNNAIIPIVAFNYGKMDKKRINSGIRCGILYTVIIMAAGALGLQLFAGRIIGIFQVSDQVKDLSIRAIRIITAGYLFVGANVAFQGIFQALGKGVLSLYVSLTRQIVVVLPLAYVLSGLPGAERFVWVAFPAAEACGLAAALFCMSFKVKREGIFQNAFTPDVKK
ncbi:MATE family efflux transporter [Clostridium sp. chh4-2]|uniref:MATE family efflux transporter n=1 Tax=Clostridium sp. chh4-2 TaxID=2067550 RepID=UPI000CCE9A24|nr:MATE family efflux transporter [Clostridium sp. chh4-2]PNV62736.1 MATE family efflux transporter [Clostridium sp. chh4-2]